MAKIKMTVPIVEMDGSEMAEIPLEDRSLRKIFWNLS